MLWIKSDVLFVYRFGGYDDFKINNNGKVYPPDNSIDGFSGMIKSSSLNKFPWAISLVYLSTPYYKCLNKKPYFLLAMSEFKININLTKNSNINSVDFENIKFGRVNTDHMFICHFKDGKMARW